ERAGVSDNTMVVFTSDNGPYWREEQIRQYNHFSAGDWRGMKGDAFEGGHRVPFIVRYPGKVAAGSVSAATISLTNLMATCMELTGCKDQAFEAVDSYSILPVLTGRANEVAGQPGIVAISSKGFFMIRRGNWKLIDGLGSGGFSAPSILVPSGG